MIVTSTISPSLKRGLRFLGVWPDMPYANVNRLIYISSILIVQCFQYLFVFAHCKPGELQDLVDSLPPTLDYSLTFIKLLTLWKNRRLVREMLAAMDADWRECVNVDQHLQVISTKANVAHFCSNILLSFYVFATVLYLVCDYAINIVNVQEGYNNHTLRPFPIKILFPFEAERSPVYELLVVTLFLHVLLNSYTIAIVNTLIFTLVLHTSGQIDIICQEFQTVSERKEPSYESFENTIEMLIEKHNKVISFSENIDKVFSFMALMQVFWNTLVICSSGLLVITSVHNQSDFGLLKSVFPYVGVMMEIFIFCFAAEYLSFKSRSIADAAYESIWYKLSSRHIKDVLLVIVRSQRELSITAGGMTNLSLEVFTSIMKASASYASILYAMY